MSNPTALSHWFPLIAAAGLPVPRTIIVDMDADAREAIIGLFDGNATGDPKPFFGRIEAAANEVGFPAFLRTDDTSGKHGWDSTCHLPDADAIPHRVWGIVEYSELASFMGLPWNRWAVREFLPTMPVGICTRYGNMPICREFRFFATDGHIDCFHPYWPKQALDDGMPEYRVAFDFDAFSTLSVTEETALREMAEVASAACGGSWSIDFLETERGWFLTDMAEAHKSFHWAGCPDGERHHA
eukprot:jgi/Tetstr1/441003/TSEL_029271.t1